tara:strand:- start:201 stop:488 length:288 start_codon:yes stop_codon:yes gene_type:complete
MATKLIQGLKIYNSKNDTLWTVPRKGTLQHDGLLSIMDREDLVKKQKEHRHKMIVNNIEREVERERMLKNLEHNLGVIVKVNRLRKFFSKGKESE